MIAAAVGRLYWRRAWKREVWHAYRRSYQEHGYRSLCGVAFRKHVETQGLCRPPVTLRCSHCDASESVLRGTENLPEAYNWESVARPKGESVNKHMEQVQQLVAQHYGVLIRDMRGPKRSKTIVLSRMIAMAICRRLTEASLPEIGRAFGGRDHTTVMNALAKIERLCREGTEFRRGFEDLLLRSRLVVKGYRTEAESDRFAAECVEVGLRK